VSQQNSSKARQAIAAEPDSWFRNDMLLEESIKALWIDFDSK